MKSKKNFKCPESGDEFYFYSFSTSIDKNGVKIYKDKWNDQIVHPKTKVVLISLDVNKGVDYADRGINFHEGTTQERTKKAHNHFKQRAKKHALSEEGKGQKQKVMDREMGNMGYDKVKKK